ncbi:MAG TPA: DinB family protein [Thermoanaerobaculia bacterium]|nr:DinB family protein [Thermoanaerobaculia bacterium]
MKRLFSSTAVLALAFAAVALPARAQETPKTVEMQEPQQDEKEMRAEAVKGQAMASAAVRAEIVRQIGDAEKKLVSLAEAMPADKFAWRPAQGVRSAGEVFAHVSSANYFLPTLWGGKMPAGVDPRGFEKEGGDKAKAIATLKSSFANVRQAIDALSDADLDRTVKIFDHDGTVREVVMIVATHAHEHLGQSIAYARSNGVTPPWSVKGE